MKSVPVYPYSRFRDEDGLVVEELINIGKGRFKLLWIFTDPSEEVQKVVEVFLTKEEAAIVASRDSSLNPVASIRRILDNRTVNVRKEIHRYEKGGAKVLIKMHDTDSEMLEKLRKANISGRN